MKKAENKKKKIYWPARVNNFWSNNFIEYKSNREKNKILSLEE